VGEERKANTLYTIKIFPCPSKIGCILRRLRVTDIISTAGFVNAGGVFSGCLNVQTPDEHVTQPDNRFVIVNHLYERGSGRRQTSNVNSDIRSFSPVPDFHIITSQILDSSYAIPLQLKRQYFEITSNPSTISTQKPVQKTPKINI
jgi:hypothetical protein